MVENVDIKISVVVPVYNSVNSIQELHSRLVNVLERQKLIPYEIVMVDDCSANQLTWPRLLEMSSLNGHLTIARMAKNIGQHAALVYGLTISRGMYVVTMDDDLQHAPEDIPLLMEEKEHEVVIGQFSVKAHAHYRKAGSSLKGFLDKFITGMPQGVEVSTFCLLQRRVVDRIKKDLPRNGTLYSRILISATNDIVGVPVSHSKRQEGRSGYSFTKLVRVFSRLFWPYRTQQDPVFPVDQIISVPDKLT